jgi:type IV pilus assembly protein PilN
MIKINLLEVEKERRVKAPSVGGNPTTILAILIFGLAAAGFISYYLYKNSQEAALQKDVEQKREKKKLLEPYIKKVDELERRRNELAKKNRAIEELRSQRTIPVHILDEVSRSLPEYLWLNTLSIKGNTLSIDGETLQEQAIPTFMKNLDASEFIGTASLIETHQKTTSGSQNVSTAFKISAPITNPFKPKTEVPEKTTSKKSSTKQ